MAADFATDDVDVRNEWLQLPERGLMPWRRPIRPPHVRWRSSLQLRDFAFVTSPASTAVQPPLLTAIVAVTLLYQLTSCLPAASSIGIPRPPTRIPRTVARR
jgi:hypothetical protein